VIYAKARALKGFGYLNLDFSLRIHTFLFLSGFGLGIIAAPFRCTQFEFNFDPVARFFSENLLATSRVPTGQRKFD
jgi:hypothetical protein